MTTTAPTQWLRYNVPLYNQLTRVDVERTDREHLIVKKASTAIREAMAMLYTLGVDYAFDLDDRMVILMGAK